MNTATRQLIEQAGVTWRRLATSATVTERDVVRWRGKDPGPPGPIHRAIVALARDLPGGDCDHDGGEG